MESKRTPDLNLYGGVARQRLSGPARKSETKKTIIEYTDKMTQKRTG